MATDRTQIAKGRIGYATVFFDWAALQSNTEQGKHGHILFDWALEGGPFTSSPPWERHYLFLAAELVITTRYRKSEVQFGWAVATEPRVRSHVTEHVALDLALEFVGQEIVLGAITTSNPIAASVAVGVLPQHGSGMGIYPKWVQREIKEVRMNRFASGHENADQDETGIRLAWDLTINIQKSSLATHWNFIKNHFGAGSPFYFYDLMNNGFYFDPTGVNTTGRYLVRFNEEVVPQVYQFGERFQIDYSLLEVE